MRFKNTAIILFSLLIFFGKSSANDLLQIADSLYNRRHFTDALTFYTQVLQDDKFLNKNFSLNFKMGVCLNAAGYYEQSLHLFRALKNEQNIIPEYVDYYIFRNELRSEIQHDVEKSARTFISTYAQHFLTDSVQFLLAENLFQNSEYQKAFDQYSQLSHKRQFKTSKALIKYRMAICRLNSGRKDDAIERMYQILKTHPASDEALEAAKIVETFNLNDEKYIFALADVYLEHRHLSVLTQLLEQFIQETKNQELREKARFYLLRQYYERGQYRSALYGFQNLLKNPVDESLESRIRLLIARCYLRLNQEEQAAKEYLEYAKGYPRRRMAAETAWKAAWIYEQIGNMNTAMEIYEDIFTQWPSGGFHQEAKFRYGFSLFRSGRYTEASAVFQEIVKSNSTDVQRNRASFWHALTYERMGNGETAAEIFNTLGSELFDDFYTLKSYLRQKDHLDTLLNVSNKLKSSFNPLKQFNGSMSTVISNFEKLFLVQELLGDDIAQLELTDKKYQSGSLSEWISLAEIYKRLSVYHRAYKIYDFISYKYFPDKDYLEKPFILKEHFPLYFDTEVNRFSRQRKVDRNLVMAVMREESAYDRFAHSYADAYGLMQIIPGTAKELAGELNVLYSQPDDLFSTELNINLGTFYLQKLLERYDGQIEMVLAAYNAGPHRVDEWRKIFPTSDMDAFVENIEFSQTRAYVRRVMRNYWIYNILDSLN